MSDVLDLVIHRRLDSPNKTRGYHWRTRHRVAIGWENGIRSAAAAQLLAWGLVENVQITRGKTGRRYIKVTRRKARRRVTVVRYVKSFRSFIRDEDNLRFAVKPINDALKRVGLIYEDSRAWLEQPELEQRVADDGVERTVVRIERLV